MRRSQLEISLPRASVFHILAAEHIIGDLALTSNAPVGAGLFHAGAQISKRVLPGLRARGGVVVGIRWQEGRVSEVCLDIPRERVVTVRCTTGLRLVEDRSEDARLVPTDEPGLTALGTSVAGVYRLRADA